MCASLPPPRLTDPNHIETRLLVVAEMLERAVEEVRKAMREVKGDMQNGDDPPPEDEKPRSING